MVRRYGSGTFAALGFAEEILPGLDFVPTATIAWFLTQVVTLYPAPAAARCPSQIPAPTPLVGERALRPPALADSNRVFSPPHPLKSDAGTRLDASVNRDGYGGGGAPPKRPPPADDTFDRDGAIDV